MPPVFNLIREIGKISEAEMRRTFNMGILVAVVAEEEAGAVMAHLQNLGENSYHIGEVVVGKAAGE